MAKSSDTGGAPERGPATAAREKAEAVRTAATEALGKAGEKLGVVYEDARETASTVVRRTTQGIENNPVAVVVGGLAVGAIAGALLPAGRKEAELLRPIGAKVGDAARKAATAAREAGEETLVELGISRKAAHKQVDKLVDTATKAAGKVGSAAARAVRADPAA